MGVKVKYQIPYELTGYIFEEDIDESFEKFPVGTSGYQESNRFLSAFWNNVNSELAPAHCPQRMPWAYYPGRYHDQKGNHASFIGFGDSAIGKLIFVVSYKQRGNISNIHITKVSHTRLMRV